MGLRKAGVSEGKGSGVKKERRKAYRFRDEIKSGRERVHGIFFLEEKAATLTVIILRQAQSNGRLFVVPESMK